MTLTMTKEEREALLADVHVAVISVADDGCGRNDGSPSTTRSGEGDHLIVHLGH